MSTSVKGTENSNILYIPDALLCITLIEIKHSTSTKLLKADRGRQIYAMIVFKYFKQYLTKQKTTLHWKNSMYICTFKYKQEYFNQKNFYRRYNGFLVVHLYFLRYSRNEHHNMISYLFSQNENDSNSQKRPIIYGFPIFHDDNFLTYFRELK